MNRPPPNNNRKTLPFRTISGTEVTYRSWSLPSYLYYHCAVKWSREQEQLATSLSVSRDGTQLAYESMEFRRFLPKLALSGYTIITLSTA